MYENFKTIVVGYFRKVHKQREWVPDFCFLNFHNLSRNFKKKIVIDYVSIK